MLILYLISKLLRKYLKDSLVLGAFSIFLSGLLASCSSSETENDAGQSLPSIEAAASSDPAIVPPREGDWDQMWSGLRDLPSVSLPISSGEATAFLKELNEKGSLPESEFQPRYMYLDIPIPNGSVKALALYTDTKILKPGTMALANPTVEALKFALFDGHAEGLAFNPFSTVSGQKVFTYTIDKFYIARLIGYLQAEPAPPGENARKANESKRKNKPYEALYYSVRALDLGEKWEKAEISKMWALHTIDFPGAQGIAASELDWFLKKYGSTPEGEALLKAIRAKEN